MADPEPAAMLSEDLREHPNGPPASDLSHTRKAGMRKAKSSPEMTTEILVRREADRLRKQAERAEQAKQKAEAANAPASSGYVQPRMPGGMSDLRRWYRQAQDAYSRRDILSVELAEIRRSFTAMLDSYKAARWCGSRRPRCWRRLLKRRAPRSSLASITAAWRS